MGRVSVRALPDTSAFARSLERYLDRIERNLSVDIPVELNAGDMARTEAELDALSRNRSVELDVDVDTSLLDKLAKATKGGGGSVGAPDVSGMANALKITAALSAGLVTLLPLVSTLILALPGFATAFLAPLGAILFGIDGIQGAAQVLYGSIVQIQESVGRIFENRLTPVFKQLLKVMAPLSAGMQQIAAALSDMLGAIVGGLTSNKGMAAISSIFSQIAEALKILAPSLGPLTEAFLTLIDAGARAFVNIAPALAGLNEKFAQFVDWANKTGLLDDAFRFLSDVIVGLITLFFGLVVVGTILAATIVRVRDFLVSFYQSIPERVRDAVRSIADFFRALPGQAMSALSGLGTQLQSLALAGMALLLVGVKTGAENTIAYLASLPTLLVEALGDLGGLLFDAGASLLQGFLDGVGSMFESVKGKLGELTGLLPDWKGPPERDATLLRNAGELVIKGFLDGLESGYHDIEASLSGLTGGLTVSAMAGPSYAPKGGFGGDPAGRGVGVLRIDNWREGTGFFEEVADDRVGAQKGIDGMLDRAFG